VSGAMNRTELHKLISLTFDERPSVRKETAKRLAEIDDPAAIFALIELSYDKDAEVKNLAQEILQKKKSTEQEVLSFAEIFGPKEKKESEEQSITDIEERKERVLSPITRLFEKKLGKDKANVIKSKMMPTIEKIYMKNREMADSDNGKRAIQEILTSYLEAMEDIGGSDEVIGVKEGQQPTEQIENKVSKKDVVELVEKEQVLEEKEGEEEFCYSTSLTPFRKIYDIMELSLGDEKIMKREMNRMLAEFKKDLKLAFDIAKKKFKEVNVTSLAKIKNGMRNINTGVVRIRNIEKVEYEQKNKKVTLMKITVYDEQGESIDLYIEPERAELLKPGMVIRIVKAYAKNFAGSNRPALWISSKGNIYIVI
jgi:hypothetical protein